MTNERFGEFVLEGPNFDGPGMPVEAAAELIAYKVLVLDVAKKLYLRQNPHRERSRRRLAADFDLRITEVRDGCADVMLVLPPVEQEQSLLPEYSKTYFDLSRDLISDTINVMSSKGQILSAFPMKSLPKFRALGKTLPSGHAIRFGDGQGNHRSRMDTETRKKFLKILDAEQSDRPQEAVGTIVEVDYERLVFHLRTADGERIQCSYGDGLSSIDRSLLADESGDGPLVSVNGTASVGRDGVLHRFTSVERVEEVVVADYRIDTALSEGMREFRAIKQRLDQIAELEDGWLGEGSKAVSIEASNRAFVALLTITHYPSDLALAPLPDGGIRLEWSRKGDDFIAEIGASDGLYLCVLPESSDDDDERELLQFDSGRLEHFIEVGELG